MDTNTTADTTTDTPPTSLKQAVYQTKCSKRLGNELQRIGQIAAHASGPVFVSRLDVIYPALIYSLHSLPVHREHILRCLKPVAMQMSKGMSG